VVSLVHVSQGHVAEHQQAGVVRAGGLQEQNE
jgi:hypothetical protein